MIILKANANFFFRRNNYPILNFLKFSKKFRIDYDPSKDYYKILELSQSAGEKEIKAAYYKLAKQHHPDLNKGQSTEKFKEINQAYEILSDKDKKIQYDASRKLNSFWGAKNYTSNQNNSSYSGYNTNYNKQYSNYNYKDDPFFKNFNDWFSGFKNQDKSEEYKNNFRTGKKYDFGKSYYQKNKEYFSSFKMKEENINDSYYNNKTETKTKSFSSKKGATFGKDYLKRNQKYYDSFKNKNEEYETNYNQNQFYRKNNSNQDENNFTSSPFLMFIISLFGVVIGSILIRRIFAPNQRADRAPAHQSQSSQFYNQPNSTYKESISPSTYSTRDSYSTPLNNIYSNKEKTYNEAELGVKDDPFYKK
jgi:curved DNA-binding protein CbpA